MAAPGSNKLNPTSDQPLSLQLADLLRAEIRSGLRAPGSQLPTESGFRDQYDVSRTTVRTALRILTHEGLIVSRKGFGSYVRSSKPLRRVLPSSRHRFAGELLEVGRIQAPVDVAEWLQIDAGEEAIVRRELQLLDGRPVILSASYFPLWVAAGTRLESPEAPDVLSCVVRGVEILRVRMPLPEESRMLRLDPGTPVVRMLHVDYDGQDRALHVADDVFTGDGHEFVFELPPHGGSLYAGPGDH